MRLALALGPIGLLLLVGCSTSKNGGHGSSCSRDSDCPAGEICLDDGCSSATDFAVRVTPNNARYVSQDLNPVSVAGSRMDLTLQSPSVLAGTVRLRKETETADYEEGLQLELRGRSSVIPGLGFQALFENVPQKTSHYSLTLPSGIWDLSLFPLDPTLPPLFTQVALRPGDTQDPGLVLQSQPVDTVKGHLLRPVAWSTETPLYYRFQVFDKTSSRPLSQSARFAVTDEFQVSFAPSGVPAVLRASPDVGSNGATILPSKDFPSDDHGTWLTPSFDLGDFGTPVDVTGTLVDPEGKPLAQADVYIEGAVRGGGVYWTHTQSDTQGQLQARLFPSAPGDLASLPQYTFTVSPPFASPCATTVRTAVVGQSALALGTLSCQPKSALTGIVRGPDQAPLAHIPVAIEGNAASANTGRSVVRDLMTDDKGAYSARVEPGSYRILAMPPVDRALPWGSKIVTVNGSAAAPDIALSDGHEINGSVGYRNQDGSVTLVAGATVTVYRASLGPSAPPKLYEVLTDALGQFRVILPKGSGDAP